MLNNKQAVISNQQSLNLSPFIVIYDIVVPKKGQLPQSESSYSISFTAYYANQYKHSYDGTFQDFVDCVI